MALGTYTGLKAAVADWLTRSDLTTQIDDFIDLVEADVNDILRTNAQVTTAALTVNAATVAIPAAVLEVKRLSINSGGRTWTLEAMDDYTLVDLYAPDTTGRPLKYTIEGANFRFMPPPDTSYSGTLTYVQGITALSSGAPTNWLLTRAPDTYLYGALTHAEPFIQNDERSATWRPLYEAAKERLRVADWNFRVGSQARIYPRRAY